MHSSLPIFRRPLVYLALIAFACATDDRSLQYGSKVTSGSSHGGDAPAPSAGAGGQPGDAGAPAGGAPEAGTPGADGGVPGVAGDGAGAGGSAGSAVVQPTTGGSNGTSGSAGSAGSAGVAGGGASGAGGSGGSGGDTSVCGDIDVNGIQDCDETLVQNARFDTGIAGWLADPGVTQAWKTDDARGSAGSGSLAVTYTTAGASNAWSMASTTQCLKAWSEYTYEVGARVMVPTGQGEGSATISLAIFGNDDCKGTLLTGKNPIVLAESGTWHALKTSLKMPPGTRSVLMRLAASKVGSASSLEVRFDDVLFRQK